jgi:signal transduction histidine kinase
MRITAAAVAIVGLAFGVGGVLLVRTHRAALIGGVEDAARLRSRDIAAALQAGDLTAHVAAPTGDENLVQVVDENGTVVAASPNIAGLRRISRLQPAQSGHTARTVQQLPVGDTAFRIVARTARVGVRTYTVYVAGGLEAVDRSTANLKRLLLVALPVWLVLVAVGAWVLTGRALRPVETVRREVEAIGFDDLHRRVPEPATGDEIERLAHTMNGMLARLDQSNERQRRFLADASHELRSPLTSLRAQLEVALAYPAGEERTEIDRDLLTDTVRLQHLVEDLLFLSRSGGLQHATSERIPVDLDVIVMREARRIRSRTAHRVDTTRVSGAQVVGDPDQLTAMVRNLLDNAERHATTTVTIALEENDTGTCFTVSDDGAGIPPDEHERIFQRFVRLDEARARDNGGAGLGLAITQSIVTAHGGSIAVDNAPGARFTVSLP